MSKQKFSLEEYSRASVYRILAKCKRSSSESGDHSSSSSSGSSEKSSGEDSISSNNNEFSVALESGNLKNFGML